MKNNIKNFSISFFVSLFIVAGPVVFFANLLIYYSYLFYTISGLILFTVLFVNLIGKIYSDLNENIVSTKHFIKNTIIMFAILEIVLLIIYNRIF